MQGLKCLGFLRTPLFHLPSPRGVTAPCLLSIYFTGPGVLLALYLMHCILLFDLLLTWGSARDVPEAACLCSFSAVSSSLLAGISVS